MTESEPYYRRDLAWIHHVAFGHHADACAPGILSRLEPVRGGVVLELGCGSGRLTRHLVDAGHRVIATDASEAMLGLAREHAGRAELRRLTLPGDPIPEVDAAVSIGHVLSYLPDRAAVERALAAIAAALREGGVMAVDLCDLAWAEVRRDGESFARVTDEWALFVDYRIPSPDRFVRRITTFRRRDDGSWGRDDEVHDNVLVDTQAIPALLASHGVDAVVVEAFGDESLPSGLVAVVGRKRPARGR